MCVRSREPAARGLSGQSSASLSRQRKVPCLPPQITASFPIYWRVTASSEPAGCVPPGKSFPAPCKPLRKKAEPAAGRAELRAGSVGSMSGRYALPCPRMQFLSPRIKHRRSICSKPVSLPRWGPLRGAWGLRRVQEGRGPKLAGCIESGSKLLLRCCGKSWKKIPWKSCCLPPRRNHRFTWPVPSPAACR